MTIDLTAVEAVLASGWVEVLRAILVVIAAGIGHRVAMNWLTRAMRRARVDTGTQILVKRGVSTAAVVLTVLVILGILGVNPAAVVTLAGAVGLAFSLAIQDILKNFFSGVYLLLERPFRVGDTIKVKEQQGVVENIGARTTVLRTPENVQVLVPNTVIFAEVVANHTHAQPAEPSTAGADGHPEAASERPSPASPRL